MGFRSGLILLSFLPLGVSAVPAELPFKRVSVTLDPVLLLIDKWQVTAEVRPVARWSGALVWGRTTGDNPFAPNPSWEVGGQVRYYPWDFPYLEPHVLAEVAWERSRLEDAVPEGEATGLTASLGGGLKHTLPFGLTGEMQLGLMGLRGDPQSRDSKGAWTPYFSTGIGWSF
jgi:hypothetical protein